MFVKRNPSIIHSGRLTHILSGSFSEEDDGFSYDHMLTRDERRWKSADRDNKGYLTKDDLTAFLHPEEYDHMKEMVILETIEDIDRDGDKRISLEEYIGGNLIYHNFWFVYLHVRFLSQ